MHSHIYLDESGDLGWRFSSPYRNGGSSRFITIGFFCCPATHFNIPQRLVRDFYRRYSFDTKIEVKASDLKSHHKEFICNETVKMLEKYPDFKLGAITANKINVPIPIQSDANTLYNYMIGESVVDVIQDHITCKINRDNRSVKVVSGKSCIDYLQTLIFFHKNKATILTDNPVQSHTNDGIIFIDWITNVMWSKYEDKYEGWSNILGDKISEKKLFF